VVPAQPLRRHDDQALLGLGVDTGALLLDKALKGNVLRIHRDFVGDSADDEACSCLLIQIFFGFLVLIQQQVVF
jgi:hypothetical protein